MRSIAIAVIATGCALAHERPADAPIDARADHADACSAVVRPMCNYGARCSNDSDCTDPAAPFCVPYFTAPSVCARCESCAALCASPDTPIATPDGERAIADLRVGDLVMSLDHGTLRAVPIARITSTPVRDHSVVHVALASGRAVEMSPGHPTADGRTFGELSPGDDLGGVLVIAVESIPYVHPATYDILPASDTGTYVAAGALVGSTLAPRRRTELLACAP
jgi:hypothetical protein